MTPIMEFKSMEQAYKCLNYWKEKLFLQDWTIKLLLVSPEEMNLEDVCGENLFQIETKSCVIKILKPEYYGDRIIKYCAESILIHELLHCLYNWVERDYNSIEVAYYDTLEHARLEQMAKSLLMTKYDLNFDWFKNFECPDLQ